jgi:invasion protein IalB
MFAGRTLRGISLAVLLTAFSLSAMAQVQSPARSRATPSAPSSQTPAPVQGTTTPQQDTIGSTPSFTTATYGDWVVRCRQQAETRSCEAAQTLYPQGQQNPIALVAITREPLRMIVQLPINITFRSHVKIALKQGEPHIDLEFAHCTQAGCFAAAQLTQETLKRLRAQSETGRIAYKDASQRDVTLVFSLRGFAPALDALFKS